MQSIAPLVKARRASIISVNFRPNIPQLSDNPPELLDLPDPAGFIGTRASTPLVKPSYTPTPKTASFVSKILALRSEHRQLKEIREEIGDALSIKTICRVATSNGLRSPRINGSGPMLMSLALKYGSDGIPAEVRKSTFGVSQQALSAKLLSEGIRRFDRRKTEERDREIIKTGRELEKKGRLAKAQKRVAKRFKLSIASISRIWLRAGIYTQNS